MAQGPSAAQQAAAIVHAQYVPIDYALSQQRKQDARAQAALQNAGRALIKQLQAGLGPAGATYDAAIRQQQGLAQGGANLLASLSPGADVQNTLQSIGAPMQQQAQVANQIGRQFGGQGAVLNVEQGTIPGASLAAQKAATQQFLAGLPTLAGLSQQQSARALAGRAADSRDALLEQRLAAAGQIPALANQIQEAQANRDFQAEQNRLGRMPTPPTQLDVYKSRTDRLRARADRAAALRRGQTAGSAAGGRTATPDQIRRFAETSYYGVKPKQQSVIQPDGTRKVVNVGGVPGIGYQKALFRLMHTYGLDLRQSQNVLNDYYAPGEDGRPIYNYQQRRKLGVTDTGKKLKRKGK